MHDDEVTNFFVVRHHATVVFPNQRGVAIAVGKVAQEEIHPTGNHVYGCRFQGLDKTGGETDREAIMSPKFSPMPRGKWDHTGIVERSLSEAAHQDRFCGRIVAKAARVHIAVTGAMS